jgi:thiamine pyrophosphate-dependent acetolactate synthase large subunit-like protein
LWPDFSDHPLDFNYNPSTMGGAIPLALGLALAQPQRDVICLSGEGALLMSLGSLVTVVDSGATNLTVVVLDNAMYEVTGGQKTPASRTATDFAGLARAAGFRTVASFAPLADWQAKAAQLLASDGPRFFCLRVHSRRAEAKSEARGLASQLEKLQSAL